MDAISFRPIIRPVAKAKYRVIQSEWRFYPTTDYKSILPVSFKDSKWWSWVNGKSVSVFEPVSVAEDYLNPWRTKVFNCSSTDCIAVEGCLLILSRDILVSLWTFRRQEDTSWPTFSGGSEVDIRWYDLSLPKLCIVSFLSSSTAEAQTTTVEFRWWSSDTKKKSLFSDAIAIKFVPSPDIDGRQLRLLRTGLTFSGVKGAGYKGRISLIAFQF